MFVEEGFRIRFANGETIDFYADSAAEKDGWMKVLSEVVGKDLSKPRNWTDIVIAKHKVTATKAARTDSGRSSQHSAVKAPPTRSAPPTPAKAAPTKTFVPAPISKDNRHSGVPTGQRKADAAAKTKSMIF